MPPAFDKELAPMAGASGYLGKEPSGFSTSSSMRSSQDWSKVGPKLDTGRRKRTPAQRAELLFDKLLDALRREWQSVRSLNLGIKSGTGIASDVLLQQLHQWVQELHRLCISQEEAAMSVGRCARQLQSAELQQLQVMLDTAGHTELSDYIRILVFNVSDPFMKTPVGAYIDGGAHSPTRGRRVAGNKMLDATAPTDNQRQGPRFPGPGREEFIRFAGYLPQDHMLSRTAYKLYESRMPQSPESDKSAMPVADADLRERMLRSYPLRNVLGPCELIKALRREAPPPPEQTYPDIEATWRATTHTSNRDALLNNIMMEDPLPPYVLMPEVRRRLLAVKEAADGAAAAATSVCASVRQRSGRTRTGGAEVLRVGTMHGRRTQADGEAQPSKATASGAAAGHSLTKERSQGPAKERSQVLPPAKEKSQAVVSGHSGTAAEGGKALESGRGKEKL